MILTDREIQLAIKGKRISIDPEPEPDEYSSTSVDLKLGQQIRLWNKADPAGAAIMVAPGAPGYSFKEVAERHSSPREMGQDGYVLEPGRFILAWTRERVRLPVENGLAARVEGKSSLARLGIGIHVTAPTIHAGFAGQIQLEMFNFGGLKVQLIPGMRVCQLIFEQSLGTPEKAYAGMFANQAAV